MVHWVQDFERVGEIASFDEFMDALAFRGALDIAFDRASVRKVEKDQSDTVSKAADPGKFKDERKWPEWEPAFSTYLSTILGVKGVPLSYVVREKEEAEEGATYEGFNERAVACAPLVGASFQADVRKVHQLIKSFLQTETAEQWIKPHARKQNGSIIAARATRVDVLRMLNAFATPCTIRMNALCSFPRSWTRSKRCLTSMTKRANH